MLSLPFESVMSTSETEIKGSILKEGWLLKRSKHLKQWRNRWIKISDECLLYSFKNRSDKKASQIIDLCEFQIVKIVKNTTNCKDKKKLKLKSIHSSSSVYSMNKRASSIPSIYQNHKHKENKLNQKKVLENKIIELSSIHSNNKTIHEFKTLMFMEWMNIFEKCQKIINNVSNTECLLIESIPNHLMSTIIASYLYSYERFILCRISKWFYSIFNINEYNFIYHYYSDCLYWIENLQQYISTTHESLSSEQISSSCLYHSHYKRTRKRTSSGSSSLDNSKYVSLDFSNGNLAHLLSDKIKTQQLKYFIIAYDNIVQLQNIGCNVLERNISFSQKLYLKEAYSKVFEQKTFLPSYIYKQQQQKTNTNILYLRRRNRNKLNRSHSVYNGFIGNDDDISYLMIPSNINRINFIGNKCSFQKYGGMRFLSSILLSNNLSSITINPLTILRLDDNMLNINDIKLFVKAILNRKTALDNLQNLYLNSNPEIYSIESMELLFQSIGKKCPNLQHLSLRRINSCNDEIFKIIVNFYKKYQNKTRLTTISLVGCNRISLEGIDWLNKNLFDLQNNKNYSLFSNIDILINIPKTQIIKHNHQNRWDKRIILC